MKKGFTLVEVLVVMAISAVTLTILGQIFFSSLRGNNKAQVITLIKQNGQNAIDVMDKNIRDADNVVCISSPDQQIHRMIAIVKNGIYTRYGFSFATNGADDYIWQDNPIPEPGNQGNPNAINDFVNSNCSIEPPSGPPNFTKLTDSKVSVSSGSFTLNKASGLKTTVKINFKLIPSSETAKKILDPIEPIEFNTTVGLR